MTVSQNSPHNSNNKRHFVEYIKNHRYVSQIFIKSNMIQYADCIRKLSDLKERLVYYCLSVYLFK